MTSGTRSREKAGFKIERPWLLGATTILLVAMMTVGGGPIEFGPRLTIMFLAGLALLAVAIGGGAYRRLGSIPLLAKLLLGLVLLLPAIQLVPLPPAVWDALPARALERDVFAHAGLSGAWHPLSSAPLDTALTLLMLFPLAGLLIAGLSFSDDETRLLMLVVVAMTAVGIIVGAIQLVSVGQSLRFYRTAHHGHLIGFFANKNHMGLMLAMVMPIGAFLLTAALRQSRTGGLVVVAWVAALYAATIATGSRAGLVLSLIAAVGTILIFVPFRGRTGKLIGLGTGAAAAALLLLFASTRSFERLFQRFQDVDSDARWDIWTTSLPAIGDYLPFGSGLGSFRDVYNKYEGIEVLTPQYANAMHQDYGQFLLEAGLFAPVVLALLLGVVGVRLVRAARGGGKPGGAGSAQRLVWVAGLIVGLALLHSMVDYPLRRPALAAMFALSVAWLIRPEGRPASGTGGIRAGRVEL